jgi:hypothetical protein
MSQESSLQTDGERRCVDLAHLKSLQLRPAI